MLDRRPRGGRLTPATLRRTLVLGGLGAWLVGGACILVAKDPAAWQAELKIVEADLHAGRFRDAQRSASRLCRQMIDQSTSGGGASASLGMALAYRALAEAGLGEREAAQWDWLVATQLFPEIKNLDLSRFHSAEMLTAASSEHSIDEKLLETRPAVVQPEVLYREDPSFPMSQHGPGRLVSVIVETEIGTDGLLRRPKLVKWDVDPILACEAVESLRTWRFKHAMLDGKPIASIFVATIRFTSRP